MDGYNHSCFIFFYDVNDYRRENSIYIVQLPNSGSDLRKVKVISECVDNGDVNAPPSEHSAVLRVSHLDEWPVVH